MSLIGGPVQRLRRLARPELRVRPRLACCPPSMTGRRWHPATPLSSTFRVRAGCKSSQTGVHALNSAGLRESRRRSIGDPLAHVWWGVPGGLEPSEAVPSDARLVCGIDACGWHCSHNEAGQAAQRTRQEYHAWFTAVTVCYWGWVKKWPLNQGKARILCPPASQQAAHGSSRDGMLHR
jgi:hypothetical protein